MIDIQRKKETLERAAANLKKEFFGINDVIDGIIDNISAWYLFPELGTRPQIVCLWGLTGVGKTDLIRKLCKELDVNSDFAEIQLEGSKSDKGIKDILTHTTITPDSHSVLLLDEIQRFKTRDEDGRDILDGGMQDIWMLLSDGTLGSRNTLKTELLTFLMELNCDIYELEKKKSNKESAKAKGEEVEDDEEDDDNPYGWSKKWNANKLYRFDNTRTREEYMGMDLLEQRDTVTKMLADPDTFIPKPYRKMLIFISGNLDEAFDVATETSSVEIDADFVHEQTKKVTVLDVKDALRRRFKPEQIARFGNNYVIYPSLSKSAYEGIIKRRIDMFCKSANKILKDNGYSLKVDKSVLTMLYNNGVYPAQGARPILSTIDNFINNVIPKAIVACDEIEVVGNITLSCNKDSEVTFECEEHVGFIKFEGELDKIRKKQREKHNLTAKVAVHEAGHAVLHCLLFNASPKDVKISVASSSNNGFVYGSVNPQDRKGILDYVKLCYGGIAAEELVFGNDSISSGGTSDIAMLTSSLVSLYRHYGLGGSQEAKVVIGDETGKTVVDNERSDRLIEEKAKKLYSEAFTLLRDNQSFLKDLSLQLRDKRELSQKAVSVIAKNHGVEAACDIGDDSQVNYKGKFDDWISS
jgi:cell division protease FtsH